jgi:hypothetical protein
MNIGVHMYNIENVMMYNPKVLSSPFNPVSMLQVFAFVIVDGARLLKSVIKSIHPK